VLKLLIFFIRILYIPTIRFSDHGGGYD
jgi:hypothetical protein